MQQSNTTQGRLDSRVTPSVKYDLEISRGSIYGSDDEEALLQAVRAGALSCGARVKEFEQKFAAYTGVRHALAVTSATSGLTLAGIAAGVGPGDEVITTPISWIATASAFSVLGAKIKFCDIEDRSLNLDPNCLKSLISPKTKAIVPVHLFGQCCDMNNINRIAREAGVAVIEDCAHTPGAEYHGKKAGNLGDMGVFSFHQQKNMSTLGEGGMITTNSDEFRDRLRSFRSLCCRSYGSNDKYLPIDETLHPMGKRYWNLMFDDIGYNYRMTDVQAAVGIVQLAKLDELNERRRTLARKLTDLLAGIPGLRLPREESGNRHVFHLFVVQLDGGFALSKEDFMWRLWHDFGIKAWSNYMPIHLTHPYRQQGHAEGECPVAEAAFERYVSLPLHPRLSDAAIEYMASSIRKLAFA
ncbi:MAG: DegT/DnrJ/EryC1/StrS family aminotransferase [Polyangiaceae bacterium]|nr:DegT/DnrJ/EryC1/StrS family aminotransferase [Polyangiaceae bacterium]